MVYLHVPFCRSFCTYCDFYSEIACRDRDAQLFEAFAEAVCAEASLRRDEIEATRDLDSLYIGGGTPSVLPLSLLRKIITALITGGVPPEPPASLRSETSRRQNCYADIGGVPSPFTEFTVEVNPEDIVEKGPDYVRGLLDLGVSRVSMGVQSLDDGILRWMNRRHDAAHARQAFSLLRAAGVPAISIDLIFGLSQLTRQTLETTVSEVLEWRPEHVSAYQLSIEEGSTLGEMVRQGRYAEAPQELSAAQYALLCERLREAGYVHYEISNWALPGHEAVHNGAYWTRHPYVGLGPGAHSFDGLVRSWNESSLDAYLSTFLPAQRRTASGNRNHPRFRKREGPADGVCGRGPTQSDVSGGSCRLRRESEILTQKEAREEEVFLGLRTARGIPEGLCAPGLVATALADGRLERTAAGRLRIPEDRWFVSDDIIADLL